MNSLTKRALSIALGLFVSQSILLANTSWTVDDDGEADFSRIQDAVDAASNGDVIYVKPGVYTGTGDSVVDTYGKAVWIKGMHGRDPFQKVVLDGQRRRRVINCVRGEKDRTGFANLVITNGRADHGAGVYVRDSSPSFVGCTVVRNIASACGGGMCLDDSDSHVVDCLITGNNARSKNGSIGGGLSITGGRPIITNTEITDNHALSGNANSEAPSRGGGLSSQDALPTFDRCHIADNSADEGGGVYYRLREDDSFKPKFLESTIHGNTAWRRGGGLYVTSSVGYSLMLKKCTVTSNKVGPYQLGFGGGLFVDSCSLLLKNSNVDLNMASGTGGGITLSSATMSMTDGTISGNDAIRMGGGLMLADGSWATITGTTIDSNSAHAGAGIFAIQSRVIFHDGTISTNDAVHGGGIFLFHAGELEARGATITGNNAHYSGGGLRAMYDSHGDFQDCHVRDNTGAGMVVSHGEITLESTSVCNNMSNNLWMAEGGSWTDLGGNWVSVHCQDSDWCPGDMNSDGVVDNADVQLWIGYYLNPFDDLNANIRADLNGDNQVDGEDYNILLDNFGSCE